MHQKLLAMQKAVLPKSKVGEAVHYTLTLWDKRTLFLAYPALELSNNLAENSISASSLQIISMLCRKTNLPAGLV